jgi:hypothetical protein
MRWKIYDEPVQLVRQRFRYFPRTFRWRGQLFEIEAVVRCWTGLRGVGRRRSERRFFHVSCVAGEFEIFQDIALGTWHLRRARFGPARVPSLRQALLAWR